MHMQCWDMFCTDHAAVITYRHNTTIALCVLVHVLEPRNFCGVKRYSHDIVSFLI